MNSPRVLIAGIGNIFLGDDGFGSEVARRLAERQWPAGVRVVDFGIRGFDLAYALMDGCDAAILVDATPQGGLPGTLYVIDPDLSNVDHPDPHSPALETHGMQPLQVFRLVQKLGGQLPRLLIVGCEPADFGPPDEGRIGLSAPVAAAVDLAGQRIEALVHDLRSNVPSVLVGS
jgi:hydrogenase maturation protease